MGAWDLGSELAAEWRRRNARALSLALAVLGGVGVIGCELAGAPASATFATKPFRRSTLLAAVRGDAHASEVTFPDHPAG
jgi:hypothetical protein